MAAKEVLCTAELGNATKHLRDVCRMLLTSLLPLHSVRVTCLPLHSDNLPGEMWARKFLVWAPSGPVLQELNLYGRIKRDLQD